MRVFVIGSRSFFLIGFAVRVFLTGFALRVLVGFALIRVSFRVRPLGFSLWGSHLEFSL